MAFHSSLFQSSYQLSFLSFQSTFLKHLIRFIFFSLSATGLVNSTASANDVRDVVLLESQPPQCLGTIDIESFEYRIAGEIDVTSFYQGDYKVRPFKMLGQQIDRKWIMRLSLDDQVFHQIEVSEVDDAGNYKKPFETTVTSSKVVNESQFRVDFVLAMVFEKQKYSGYFGTESPLRYPESSPDDQSKYEMQRPEQTLSRVLSARITSVESKVESQRVEVDCYIYFPDQFQRADLSEIAIELNRKYSSSTAKKYLEVAKELTEIVELSGREILQVIDQFDKAENSTDDASSLIELGIEFHQKRNIDFGSYVPVALNLTRSNGANDTSDTKSVLKKLEDFANDGRSYTFTQWADAFSIIRARENGTSDALSLLTVIADHQSTWLEYNETLENQASYVTQLLSSEGGASNTSDVSSGLNKVYDWSKKYEIAPVLIIQNYRDLLSVEGGASSTSDAVSDLNLCLKTIDRNPELQLNDVVGYFKEILRAEGGKGNTSDAQSVFKELTDIYEDFNQSLSFSELISIYKTLLRKEGGSSGTSDALSDLNLIQNTAKSGYDFNQIYNAFSQILDIEGSSGTSDAQSNLKLILDYSTPSNFTDRFDTFLRLLKQEGSRGTSKVQSTFKQIYN